MRLIPPPDTRAKLSGYAAVLGAALLVAVAAGCGTSSSSTSPAAPTAGASGSADAFIKSVTTQFARGQSGRLWDTLHPADQAVVTRDRYTSCQSNSGFDLKKFKVLETYADPVDVAGKTTPATAVSLQTTSDDGVTTATMHAVVVSGTWRWILSQSDYAAYKVGKCPPTA